MRGTLLCSLLVLSLLGCSNDSGGSKDVKSPYPAFTPTVVQQFTTKLPDGKTETLTFRSVEQKEIGGEVFDRFQLGPFDNQRGGFRVLGKVPDPEHLVVAEGEISAPAAGGLATLGLPTAISAVLNAPVSIALDPPIGEAQTIDLSGTTTVGKSGETGYKQESGDLQATMTLVEKGVTVQTAMGPIAGCNHYQASATPKLIFNVPTEVSGDIYYHPSLGLVKAKLAKPLDVIDTTLASTEDAVDLGDGWASVHKMALVGSGNNYRLDTYDVNKQFDADKNTHAKMLLEIRWQDETSAKTDKKPFIGLVGEPEFGTAMGIFPAALEHSLVSIFHPEENDQGYHYWYAFVDQAAKNEATNGISYHIAVNYDSSFSPIRVTGRIIYKKYTP